MFSLPHLFLKTGGYPQFMECPRERVEMLPKHTNCIRANDRRKPIDQRMIPSPPAAPEKCLTFLENWVIVEEELD